MKKWIGTYIAVCLIVLVGLSSIVGGKDAEKADFGIINHAGGYTSQLVQSNHEDYVIFQGLEEQKFQIVNTYKNLEGYETVGTVHQNRLYYLFRYTNNTKQAFGIEPVVLEEEEQWHIPVLEAEGAFFAAGSTDTEVLVSLLKNDGTVITEYAIALGTADAVWEERASFALTEGHYAVCGAYDGKELVLVQEDGRLLSCGVVVRELEAEIEDTVLASCFQNRITTGAENVWNLYAIKEAVIPCAVPAAVLAALVVLLLYGSRRKHQIVYRSICYTEVICMISLIIAGVLLAESRVQQELFILEKKAEEALEDMEENQLEDGTVKPSVYWAQVQEKSSLLDDFIIVKAESGRVMLSKELTAGMELVDYYGAKTEELIEQVESASQTVSMKLEGTGKNPYLVALRDWTDVKTDTVLVAVLSGDLMESRMEEAVTSVWKIIFVLMLVVTLVHIIIICVFGTRWEKMVKALKYVATEKKAFEGIPERADGLQNVWSSLDVIGRNMAKLDYERDMVYRSYYRFVPKDMELLLQKPEMAEIELGDSSRVNGCMVHFSLENLKSLETSEYMRLMTDSLKLMHKVRELHGGIFLSAGADLLDRKIFFEENKKSALLFAVDLLHAYAEHGILMNRDFILMLHSGEYHYGVSGVEDMMTPYMYCADEKVLEPYVKTLAKAHVKIALTEKSLELLDDSFTVRYIGFVTDGTSERLQIYECLDAYKEDLRRIMAESAAMFQNALQLFYSNDLYLARNAFNEVLKINEQDEIARWYLFHCEYHLNKPEAEVSYGLFENLNYD